MRFYLPLLALALTFLIGTNAISTAESNHAARDLAMQWWGRRSVFTVFKPTSGTKYK
jgi:hypothetical protein